MNTFGRNFRVTTFGESHGAAIGVVIDGCPPGFAISEKEIQYYLDKRKPGQSDLVTPRKEADAVQILSGVFQGYTLGTPICLLIQNTSMKSADYDELQEIFRPGHADRGYFEKYGIRDHRGGGRSSGRETAARVAAGAIARRYLEKEGIIISGSLTSVHGEKVPERMEQVIRDARDQGESVGGVVSLVVSGCPPGLGDPVFGKLDALIAYAMMGIGGVKAVEIGSGVMAASMTGSEHNDRDDFRGYLSIMQEVSLGDLIWTGYSCSAQHQTDPSIRTLQQTVDTNGMERKISVRESMIPVLQSGLCRLLKR